MLGKHFMLYLPLTGCLFIFTEANGSTETKNCREMVGPGRGLEKGQQTKVILLILMMNYLNIVLYKDIAMETTDQDHVQDHGLYPDHFPDHLRSLHILCPSHQPLRIGIDHEHHHPRHRSYLTLKTKRVMMRKNIKEKSVKNIINTNIQRNASLNTMWKKN